MDGSKGRICRNYYHVANAAYLERPQYQDALLLYDGLTVSSQPETPFGASAGLTGTDEGKTRKGKGSKMKNIYYIRDEAKGIDYDTAYSREEAKDLLRRRQAETAARLRIVKATKEQING